MRITGLRATPVNIPLEAPRWWTGGHYRGTSKTVVEVLTDEGLIGMGEAPSVDVVATVQAMGERLAGFDPLDVAACEARCVPPWQIVQNTDDPSVVKAFGAIEIGLWDLRGKAWGEPLHRLLDGAVRTEILFTEYFAFRPGRELRLERARSLLADTDLAVVEVACAAGFVSASHFSTSCRQRFGRAPRADRLRAA